MFTVGGGGVGKGGEFDRELNEYLPIAIEIANKTVSGVKGNIPGEHRGDMDFIIDSLMNMETERIANNHQLERKKLDEIYRKKLDDMPYSNTDKSRLDLVDKINHVYLSPISTIRNELRGIFGNYDPVKLFAGKYVPRGVLEDDELKRQEESAKIIEQQRAIDRSLEQQRAQEKSIAQAQAESEHRALALQQQRTMADAEWKAKEQHRAQSQSEGVAKAQNVSKLAAQERERAQLESELGEKSRHHGELESKHSHEREERDREMERNLQEIREALRAEEMRKEAFRAQEEEKVRSEERYNDISSKASRAAQTQAEMAQFGRPHSRDFQSASQAFQPERVFPSRLDSEGYARSQMPRAPSRALAMAEAEARAREFSRMPNASAAAPRAADPNVPSSHNNIDPERARLNAEIMSRAGQFLRTPHLPSTPLQERFEFPHIDELQASAMAREYGVEHPHYEKAKEQAQLSQQTLPQGIHSYMDPYEQLVVNRIAEEGNRNLFENILPTLEGRYMKLGQHGGMRHHDLRARAIRDVQKEITAVQNQARSSGYQNAAQNFNTDRARNLESSKMHTALGMQEQASRLSNIEALRRAGQESRSFGQGLKDYQQHELERVHKHPQEQLNAYSQLAQGNPYSTSTHHYKPSVPQSWHRHNYRDAAMNVGLNAAAEFGGPGLNQVLGLFGVGGNR